MPKEPKLTLDDFYGDQAKLDKAQGIYDAKYKALNPEGTALVNTQKPTFDRGDFGSMGEWAEFNRAYDNAWDRTNPAGKSPAAEVADGLANGTLDTKEAVNNYGVLAQQYMDKAQQMGEFSYDFNKDPLFKMLSQSYMQQAKQAANNASALAAARTGGYGNSYGAAAAGQQYNAALGDLYDQVPELQQAAYNRYLNSKQDLYNQADYYNNLGDTYYGRQQDALAQENYINERDYAREQDAYNRSLNEALQAAQLGNYTMLENMFGVKFDEARQADQLNRMLSILQVYGDDKASAATLIKQMFGNNGTGGTGDTGTTGTTGTNGTTGQSGTGAQSNAQQTGADPAQTAGTMAYHGNTILLPPAQTGNGTYRYYQKGSLLYYEFTDNKGSKHEEVYTGPIISADGKVLRGELKGINAAYTPSYPVSTLQAAGYGSVNGNSQYISTGNPILDQMLADNGYVDPEVTAVLEAASGNMGLPKLSVADMIARNQGIGYTGGVPAAEAAEQTTGGTGSGGGKSGSSGSGYGGSGGKVTTGSRDLKEATAQTVTPTMKEAKVSTGTWDALRKKYLGA